MSLSPKIQQFADTLLRIDAIKFGAFKLKIHKTHPHAPLSPFYINFRVVQSDPQALAEAVDVYCHMAQNLQFDLVAGIPHGASTLGAVTGWQFKKPIILPRGEKKKYGMGGSVDGIYSAGQKVLVIDDLISQGASKLETIHSLEEEGLVVTDILVLLDRKQGGSDELRVQGYTLHAPMTAMELFEYYRSTGKISEEKFEEIVGYVAQG